MYPLCDSDYQTELRAARERHHDVTTRVSTTEVPVQSAASGTQLTGHYELHAVLTHAGRTADAGHYVAWVRDEHKRDIWWKLDDETVSKVSEEDILKLDGGGKHAYSHVISHVHSRRR